MISPVNDSIPGIEPVRAYRVKLLGMKMGPFQWIDYLVLLSFLLLVRLPAAFGLQFDIRARLVCLLPIIFVAWRRLAVFFTARKPVIFAAHKYAIFYVLYLLVVVAAFIRTILTGGVETSKAVGNLFLLLLAQTFIFLIATQTKRPGEELKKVICLSWMFYIFVNLLMAAAHLSARNDIFITPQVSKMASYLKLTILRTTFPTATGINSFGNIGGVLLIGSFFILRDKRQSLFLRGMGAAGILASLVTLVATDSRAATAFAVLVIACSYVPHPLSRLFRLLPIAAVILPLLILGTLKILPDSVVRLISRNQSDALTLSNRTLIWSAGLETLQDTPDAIWFGYGYRGQTASGAVEKYKYLFVSFAETTSLSLHNTFLQAVFESGVIGALLLVITLTVLFFMLDRERRATRSVWTNTWYFTLIFLTLVSSTDSILNFDSTEAYMIFLFIATVSFFSMADGKKTLADSYLPEARGAE